MPKPVHPGRVLADELGARRLTTADLASAIGAPVERVEAILAGNVDIDSDLAGRLGDFLRTGAELWEGLQLRFAARRG